MPGEPESSTHRYEVGLVAVAFIWGINFPVVKDAISHVGPLTFNASRFTLSGILLGILYWREQRNSERKPVSIPWLYVVGLGLLGHFAYQMLFILGIDRTTSGSSAFLISSSPLWTAVVARLGGFERLSIPKMVGLCIAFLGAVTLVAARVGVDLGEPRLVGNVLSLGAAAAWGSYTALSRPALRDYSPIGLAFWTMMPALPLLWIGALLEPSRPGWILDPALMLAVAYSGLFSVGLAYVIWNAGIQHVGPSRTAVYANMVPVVALVIGVIWLNETATLLELVGAGMILSGLFLVRR